MASIAPASFRRFAIKLLLIDIETYPSNGWFWQVRDVNIAPNQIEHPGGMLCWAAKWLGRKDAEYRSIDADGRDKMVGRIHELLDEADAVIHYNGNRFDTPLINQEFLISRMRPPSPFAQIDLYQTAKKFRFPHTKMECVLKVLGHPGKIEHEGFPLWRKCIGGPWYPNIAQTPRKEYESAWRRMRQYNMRDTAALESLYHDFLPWIKNHPNQAVYGGEKRCCPNCGSTKLQARGEQVTTTLVYRRLQCRDCGKWSRSRTADKSYGKPELVAA